MADFSAGKKWEGWGIARASGKLNVRCRICSSKEAQEKIHFWLE
jgi:hypothetical protein